METTNWYRAERHLEKIRQALHDVGGVSRGGLAKLDPLVTRFNDGERTTELYESMTKLGLAVTGID